MTSLLLFVPVSSLTETLGEADPSPEHWHPAARVKAPLSGQNNPHTITAGGDGVTHLSVEGCDRLVTVLNLLSAEGVSVPLLSWQKHSIYLSSLPQVHSTLVDLLVTPARKLKNDLPAA